MKILRWVLPVALVYGAFAFGQGSVESMKGKPMPAFTMTSFKGAKLTNASLKGKPYILDFWATWCSPCKAASPALQSLHQKYASKGLVVIGANMGETPQSMAQAKAYPGEHKFTFTFTANNDKLANKMGVTGIPCFVFVDKTGKIHSVKTGYGPSSPAEFESIVKKLL